MAPGASPLHVTHRWGLLHQEAGATPTEAASRVAGRDGDPGCLSTVLPRTWALDQADLGSHSHVLRTNVSCVTPEDGWLRVLGHLPRPQAGGGVWTEPPSLRSAPRGVLWLFWKSVWSRGWRCHPCEARPRAPGQPGRQVSGRVVPLGVGGQSASCVGPVTAPEMRADALSLGSSGERGVTCVHASFSGTSDRTELGGGFNRLDAPPRAWRGAGLGACCPVVSCDHPLPVTLVTHIPAPPPDSVLPHPNAGRVCR